MDAKSQAIFAALKALIPVATHVTGDLRTEVAAHVVTNGDSEHSQKVVHVLDKTDEALGVLNAVLQLL